MVQSWSSPLFFIWSSRNFKSFCYDLYCDRSEWWGNVAQNVHDILFPIYVSCWQTDGVNTIDEHPWNDVIDKLGRKSKIMTRRPDWHVLKRDDLGDTCFCANFWAWELSRPMPSVSKTATAALAFSMSDNATGAWAGRVIWWRLLKKHVPFKFNVSTCPVYFVSWTRTTRNLHACNASPQFSTHAGVSVATILTSSFHVVNCSN